MSYLLKTLSKTTGTDDLKTVTAELADPTYPWHVEQSHDGWPASGFDHKTVDIKVRRIDADDRKEVQFEIGIDDLKGKRVYSHSASFSVSLELAEKLSAVLAPDVLAALEAYHTAVNSGFTADPELWAKAERLYAKAKGERA